MPQRGGMENCMKILLADDDKLIRYSLKSMLTEIPDREFMITEASNGLEMINRCIEYDPDIAFVDIRMPHLNGIDAIRECKKVSPNTEFVIVTGYSDFEYAQKCIALGVSDYILKPIEEEYLSGIIQKLKEKLSHQMTQKNNLFQLYIHDYFFTPNHDAPDSLREEISAPADYCYMAFSIFIDCTNDSSVYNDILNNLTGRIKSFGNLLLPRNMYYSIIYSPEGLLRLIFKLPSKQTTITKSKIEQISKSLTSDSARLYLFYTENTEINSICDAFDCIEEYQYIRMGMKPCQANLIETIDFEHIELSFYKHLFGLITAYLEANEGLYTHNLNIIYKNYCDMNISFPLENLSQYVKCVLGNEVSVESFKLFMKSFVLFSDKMYNNLEHKVTDKIDLIIEYINHSYMNDISINQIASKFDLTPNYVSKLFHDKTKTKFIDYLTNIRINNGKKLLISNSDTPVKEIALMVGYYSSRHFSTIFKKYTGLYPTEYRKNHIG